MSEGVLKPGEIIKPCLDQVKALMCCEGAALEGLTEVSGWRLILLIVMHLYVPSLVTSVSPLLNLCPSIS